MAKIKTMDGNEACSRVAYLFTEVAGIYPITPSSPMAEHIDEWASQGEKNFFGDPVKVVEMQSEAGAAGMIHGALQAGCLATTFTASQGLLLMIPNMYKIAGEMLPCVFHVAARSLSTHALSIFGDHQDVYATRMTGFAMLSSSSVEQAGDMAAVAHLSALSSSLPFLHFFDGFRTSHELSKIEILEREDIEPLIDQEALERFHNRALSISNPVTRGLAENDDIYFQATEVRNTYYDQLPDIVSNYMEKINQIRHTNYQPFVYYGDPEADRVIVAMGSVCETVKETIDDLNQKGEHLGLIEVHLYRPFSKKYFFNVLPETVKKIAVLDRTKEAGSIGEPLYLDVKSILPSDITVVGGRYGLSSKNTTPAQVKAVFDMLANPRHNFTIGIEDDITNLSLPIDSYYHLHNSKEMLIYGYGSDGMVTASKSILKLIGTETDQYVQGYFQYDSKKSGGVTVSHLRFSDQKIRSTYYVEAPSIVVVTKDSYLSMFDCMGQIQENGIFLLNTSKTVEEVCRDLSDSMKDLLVKKKIQCYMINAYEVARKVGLGNRISTIMESAIMYITHIVDYELANQKMKSYIRDRFFKKGEEVVHANELAIDLSVEYLKPFSIESETYIVEMEQTPKDVYQAMVKRLGNELPTSAFIDCPEGSFRAGTSQLEKRALSDTVPSYIKENCIQCNQCSIVCPHGVIRPYLLSEEEYQAAPDYVKNQCKKAIGKGLEHYYSTIAISIADCTGCGLCLKACPGMRGALALMRKKYQEEKENHEQDRFDYLNKYITEKKEVSLYSVKGSQLVKPKFEFSGACAGCGETPYLKLLTQLFGDHMIIANATGCSSIYGGSAPSTPYTVPWASSLFEDNAEYGYGMKIASDVKRLRLKTYMQKHLDERPELYQKWLDHMEDPQITSEIKSELEKGGMPDDLQSFQDDIIAPSVWMIGGDGWAYDIGYSGIDHILASNENVNILVLDSQVYSNTGGQSSKSSPKGSIAAFTSHGKSVEKKDLARIAMCYPNVYVAQVSIGANPLQVIRAMKEAEEHVGPSIILAYSPCISHGIRGGMEHSMESSKMATLCGYYPTFRYSPDTKTFTLDSKRVDFDQYEDYLETQNRYRMLKVIHPEQAETLLKENKEAAIRRYQYYQSLEQKK